MHRKIAATPGTPASEEAGVPGQTSATWSVERTGLRDGDGVTGHDDVGGLSQDDLVLSIDNSVLDRVRTVIAGVIRGGNRQADVITRSHHGTSGTGDRMAAFTPSLLLDEGDPPVEVGHCRIETVVEVEFVGELGPVGVPVTVRLDRGRPGTGRGAELACSFWATW